MRIVKNTNGRIPSTGGNSDGIINAGKHFFIHETDFILLEGEIILLEGGFILHGTDFILYEGDFILQCSDFIVHEWEFIVLFGECGFLVNGFNIPKIGL